MDFGPLISSVAALRELVPALVAERDRQKAAAIEHKLTEQISHAQMRLLEIVALAGQQAEALAVARERVRELRAQQSERERYQLVEAGSGLGTFAYRLRPAGELAERSDEPVHFLCQLCFDAGRKVVLQGRSVLVCAHDGRHSIRVIAADPKGHIGSYF